MAWVFRGRSPWEIPQKTHAIPCSDEKSTRLFMYQLSPNLDHLAHECSIYYRLFGYAQYRKWSMIISFSILISNIYFQFVVWASFPFSNICLWNWKSSPLQQENSLIYPLQITTLKLASSDCDSLAKSVFQNSNTTMFLTIEIIIWSIKYKSEKYKASVNWSHYETLLYLAKE